MEITTRPARPERLAAAGKRAESERVTLEASAAKVEGRSALVKAVARFPALGLPLFKLYMVLRFLLGRRTQAQLYFGRRIQVDLWQMMLQRMYYFRFWEPNISSLFEQILRPGDVFVDLGGHVGYFTLLGSHLVGPQGGVVAVEALPANFAALESNARANGATNIRAVHCAVSDVPGELNLFQGVFRNTGTATTDETCGRPLVARVPARPLDDILTDDEKARLALVKIDVEGAELRVLRRLLETLDQYPQRLQIICEFDTGIGGDALRAVFAGFLERGFEAFAVANPYSWESYLNWAGPAPLRPITTLPEGGSDVLLRRGTAHPPV